MRIEFTIARREFRGDKGLFAMSALTAAMAAALLAATLSLADLFQNAFDREARALLGGDVAVRLSQRDFKDNEVLWLENNSRKISRVNTARVLAAANNNARLAGLRAVDQNYPLAGAVEMEGGEYSPDILFAQNDDGTWPAIAAPALLKLLGLQSGDVFSAAGITLRIADILVRNPDPDRRMWFGTPSVLISNDAMRASGLLGPGGIVERNIRVLLSENESPKEWRERLNAEFPEHDWRARTPDEAAGGARRFIERMRKFLALASLAAMLVAGIGAGGAVSAFLRARMRAIAVLKMLGARAEVVRRVYLFLSLAFVAVGAVVGIVAGELAVMLTAPALSPSLPFPLQAEWSWPAALRSFLIAMLTGVAFAAPPVARFARLNPAALFNAGGREDDLPALTARDWILSGVAAAGVAALAPLEWSEKILMVYVALAAAGLWGLALWLARGAETLAPKCGGALRLGLLAVARNRRQAAGCVVSFGLGVAVLTATMDAEANFRAAINDALRAEAPTFYMLGAREEQLAPLEDELKKLDESARLRALPYLRGRIIRLDGAAASELEAPPGLGWVLRGERALTWIADDSYIGASRVVAGKIWDENESRPQASFDAEAAAAFGVEIGDELVLKILGRPLTVVVTSLREIDWRTFDINFVLFLSERPFGSAPHTFMGAAFMDPDAADKARGVSARLFPNVALLDMGRLFDTAGRLLGLVGAILRAVGFFMLLGGFPIVAAAIVGAHRRRLREAAVLRLLGVRRRVIVGAGIWEFATMGILAAVPAAVLGLAASYAAVEQVFELAWSPQWAAALGLVFGAVAVFLGAGAAGLARAAKEPPLNRLRNE